MDLHLNLRTFAEVVRSRSFSEAARTLHVVPSVVAKRISQLEKTAGVRLFERSTRSVRLTEAGETLQARALPLLAEFDEVLHATRRSDGALEGHIRLTAPTTLTMLYLGQVLDGFLVQHPRITMDIVLVDRSLNPAEEGFDMVISGRTASYEGVAEVPLCPMETVLCAAPAYLEAAGTPSHPHELADHAGLIFKPYGRTWTFQGKGAPVTVDVPSRLTADDNCTLLRAALAGRGIAALPRYVCGRSLDEGRVQAVLPGWALPMTTFRAYVPRRRLAIARVGRLIEWLTRQMGSELPDLQAPCPGAAR